VLDGDGRTFDEIAAERAVAKAEAVGAAGPTNATSIRQQISAARAKIGSSYVSRMVQRLRWRGAMSGANPSKRSKKSSDGNHSVGYGKPPEATRFKPGQSGNPKGRPKGSKNLRTLFSEELRRSVILKENGKTRRVPKAEAIVKQVINKALGADPKSTIIVLDEMRRLEALADGQHAAAPDISRPEDQATFQSIVRRIQLIEGARDAGSVGIKPRRRAE
jgi:hypothetical protein